jgi:uncharacterized OB-fold protein
MPEPVALHVSACTRCGALDPGGRASCAGCGGALAPRAVSGRGTLVSWTIVRRPPAGFDADGPYAVALIELAEGMRITARLAAHAAEPALGAAVTVRAVAGDVPVASVDAETHAH